MKILIFPDILIGIHKTIPLIHYEMGLITVVEILALEPILEVPGFIRSQDKAYLYRIYHVGNLRTCTPVITERGIAINPRRQDLIDSVKGKGLPLVTIEELKETAEKICGKPEKAAFDERVVAAIKWVDGTVIDAVRKVKR